MLAPRLKVNLGPKAGTRIRALREEHDAQIKHTLKEEGLCPIDTTNFEFCISRIKVANFRKDKKK